jgi:hypothetical protein
MLPTGCGADRLHDAANRQAAPDHGVVVGVTHAADDGGAQDKAFVAHTGTTDK